MSKHVWQIFKIIVFLMITIFTVLHFTTRYESKRCQVLFGEPNGYSNRPFGELVKNIYFSQSVDVQQIKVTGHENDNAPLCLEVYMANYNDRPNVGQIRVGVVLDGREITKSVSVEDIRDNAWHRVMLDAVPLSKMYAAHEMKILIAGINSPPGKAVTAWTTRDISCGKLSTTNKELVDRSLIFRLGFLIDASKKNQDSLFLAILGVIAMIILIFQSGGRGNRSLME